MVDTGRQIERATGRRRQQRRRGKKGRQIVSQVTFLLLGVGGIMAVCLATLLLPAPNAEARSSDGVRLPSWFIKLFPECRGPTILVFQENAGNIAHHLEMVPTMLLRLQCNSSMLSCGGYGTSGGYPSQHDIIKDAQMDPPSHMQMLYADIRQCNFAEFPTSMRMNDDNYRRMIQLLPEMHVLGRKESAPSQNDNHRQTSEKKHFSRRKESGSSQNDNYGQTSEKHFPRKKESGSTQNDTDKQTSYFSELKKIVPSESGCFFIMFVALLITLFVTAIFVAAYNQVREV